MRYRVSLRRKGELVGSLVKHNLVFDEGKQEFLRAWVGKASQGFPKMFYVVNSGFTGFSSTDTNASHPGWSTSGQIQSLSNPPASVVEGNVMQAEYFRSFPAETTPFTLRGVGLLWPDAGRLMSAVEFDKSEILDAGGNPIGSAGEYLDIFEGDELTVTYELRISLSA